MSEEPVRNADRPTGHPIDFVRPSLPGQPVLTGPWTRLERLDAARHAADVFNAQAGQDWLWDYMPNGPFHGQQAFSDWMSSVQDGADPCFYAIIDPDTGKAVGEASFMRVDAAMGVIEIGNILLTPALQQRREASAALMAMICWAFDAGYRRVEWKCNSLNAPSRRAALRLGFSYEGTFRNHMIVKGLNRDTAWFAITDQDWRALRPAYEQWLAPDNFDADGQQRQSLSSLTEVALPGRQDG